jgi:hypothetical protein
MKIECRSFGFKNGADTQSDFIFDVRCLPNPFYIEHLKYKTGLDKPVRDYVLNDQAAKEYLEKVIDIIKSGSGGHFDPLVVEKFLAIKLLDIVNVFLTENVVELDEEDAVTLEKYNLLDLYYSIINNCSNKLLLVFNKYYVGVDFENE